MENADLVLVLIVTAIGAFAGGILFGMWLIKRMQPQPPKPQAFHASVERLNAAVGKVMAEESREANAFPVGGKYPASRVGWPAIKRQLEEDDPEARRHEEIMQANGGN